MFEIVPAIIAKNFNELAEKVKLVEPFVKTVQLDTMDGVFVPNETWPFGVGASQGKLFTEQLNDLKTSLFLEAHLMVAEPEKILDEWLGSKVGRIIVHYEAVSKFSSFQFPVSNEFLNKPIFDLIKKTHNAGKQIGIALNPETPIEVLAPHINDLDLVLLMSVNPGFAGQKFLPAVLEKIKALRQKYPNVKIEVDGGVNLGNVKEIIAAGADILVAGSAIWESNNIEKIIREF